MRLGYIGAPIATSISINTLAVLNLIYVVYYSPKAARHPISRRSFQKKRHLGRLGFAAVGESDNTLRQSSKTDCYTNSTNIFPVVDLDIFRRYSKSVCQCAFCLWIVVNTLFWGKVLAQGSVMQIR